MKPPPAVKEIRTLADLTPDPANARAHTSRNIGMIADSLQEVGFARSIVIDEGGVILAGNGVAEAAGQVGMEAVRVVEADGDELIVVRRANLTPAQKTRLALFDNRATDLSSFDPAVLATLDPPLLEGLWRPEELAELLATIPPDVGPGGGGDEFDATPTEGPTRCHPGDVWQIGPHRLLVGDSTDPAVIEHLMDGTRAGAVVTDPPYGMHLDTSFAFSKGNEAMAIKATKGYAPVIGDDRDFDASWLFATFPTAKEVFLFGADYYVDTLPNYGKDGGWMVWDKKNEALRNVLGLADFELIWSRQRHKRRVYNFLWNGALGTESEDTKRRVHPTQKPVRLLEAILSEYATGVLVDPYLGSGTTLIAAHRTGRVCYGCEIEPKYADVILRRAEAEGIAPITRRNTIAVNDGA